MEFKRDIPHNIHIQAAITGGYYITVGCQILVYSDSKKMLADLAEYLDNPREVINQYYESEKASLIRGIERRPGDDTTSDLAQPGGPPWAEMRPWSSAEEE